MKALNRLLTRPATRRRRRPQRRKLAAESLERRELLAGDIFASHHNYDRPNDVNADGIDSARDALAIINFLSSQHSSESENVAIDPNMFYDVNGDDKISSGDALRVMNELAIEETGEWFEILLIARTVDDEPISANADGVIEWETDKPFNLEVSYNDLRPDDQAIGLFQLYTDLLFNEADVLEPVLNETQRLYFGHQLRQEASDTTGVLTFSIENSDTTYTSTFTDFANSPRQEVVNALAAFGYGAGQYELLQNTPAAEIDDLDFVIIFSDPAFADQDLPNISVSADGFSQEIPTPELAFAPRNDDGSINSDAVRFNIDFNSRTFNDGQRFYSSQFQNFSSYDPAQGFNGIGGLGRIPPSGGGISGLTNDNQFINPFDAFSLRVQFVQPVVDFVASVITGSDEEAVLAFGSDEPVPHDFVLLDEDSQVKFNVGDPNSNRPPVVASGIGVTISETDASLNVDLLDGVTDPDGDSLRVSDVVVQGNAAGITVDEDTHQLTIDPSRYFGLHVGQLETIYVNYRISDRFGDFAVSTAQLTINGQGQPASVGGSIFIDHIENARDTSRNGFRDGNESGVGGVTLKLFSAADANVSGDVQNFQVVTDSDGGYSFDDIAPGTYRVQAYVGDDLLGESSDLVYVGESEIELTIGAEGGHWDLDFALLGMIADPRNILASTYVNAQQDAIDQAIAELDA